MLASAQRILPTHCLMVVIISELREISVLENVAALGLLLNNLFLIVIIGRSTIHVNRCVHVCSM